MHGTCFDVFQSIAQNNFAYYDNSFTVKRIGQISLLLLKQRLICIYSQEIYIIHNSYHKKCIFAKILYCKNEPSLGQVSVLEFEGTKLLQSILIALFLAKQCQLT